VIGNLSALEKLNISENKLSGKSTKQEPGDTVQMLSIAVGGSF